MRRSWLLLLLGGLACTYGAVVQRVTGPDESEITHASVGGGVNVYLTGSALGTPFNPRELPLAHNPATRHDPNPLSDVCALCPRSHGPRGHQRRR